MINLILLFILPALGSFVVVKLTRIQRHWLQAIIVYVLLFLLILLHRAARVWLGM